MNHYPKDALMRHLDDALVTACYIGSKCIKA